MIEVTTDEAVGVALAMGRQIYVDRDIWEGARVSFASPGCTWYGSNNPCVGVLRCVELCLNESFTLVSFSKGRV